jgi:hypothetical protein
MWWKLTLLFFVTAVLVVIALPPIQTHAVKYDPYNEPPPQTWTIGGMLNAFNWTPTGIAMVITIVIGAACVAFWVVRASR